MKTTLLLLALAAATPALAESPGEMLDRCSALANPRDMSADCTDLRAAFNAQVLNCVDSPVKPGLSQQANAPAGASHRTRARYLLCTSQAAAQFRLTGN